MMKAWFQPDSYADSMQWERTVMKSIKCKANTYIQQGMNEGYRGDSDNRPNT